ncbi:hypothetical protein EDB92DRAFT_1152097 [Lactarius akahatsu]|uniref:Uncharacterized protein n=1 Tax=Lactarius akahatsu TaxID=416441 RepID=A0AAD4LF14_9AGAM|nr:hypothetical protein EDB92DRAFT_1152097 [Lactarius akahatsu]
MPHTRHYLQFPIMRSLSPGEQFFYKEENQLETAGLFPLFVFALNQQLAPVPHSLIHILLAPIFASTGANQMQYQVPTISIRFRLFQPAATHALHSRTGQTLAHAHPRFRSHMPPLDTRKLRSSLQQRSPCNSTREVWRLTATLRVTAERAAYQMSPTCGLRRRTEKGRRDLGVRNPCGGLCECRISTATSALHIGSPVCGRISEPKVLAMTT